MPQAILPLFTEDMTIVSLHVDDATMKQINDVTVSFGHGEVFKKRNGSLVFLRI